MNILSIYTSNDHRHVNESLGMLKSFLKHHQSMNIYVYISCDKLMYDQYKVLYQDLFTKFDNVKKYEFICLTDSQTYNDILAQIDENIMKNHYNKYCLYKFLSILNLQDKINKTDKIIYIDNDILINDNIEQFINNRKYIVTCSIAPYDHTVNSIYERYDNSSLKIHELISERKEISEIISLAKFNELFKSDKQHWANCGFLIIHKPYEFYQYFNLNTLYNKLCDDQYIQYCKKVQRNDDEPLFNYWINQLELTDRIGVLPFDTILFLPINTTGNRHTASKFITHMNIFNADPNAYDEIDRELSLYKAVHYICKAYIARPESNIAKYYWNQQNE